VRMRRLLVALAAGLAARGVRADETPPAGGYGVDTVVSAGYRVGDIDGAKDKYREDYNLRSGLRLLTFDVDGHAKAPESTRLDRFRLEVDTPGDEPVSHFRLSAADQKLYELRADFTRSKYFYAVPQLFEAPVADDVRLDDLHDFDLTRTNGRKGPTSLPCSIGAHRMRRSMLSTKYPRLPSGANAGPFVIASELGVGAAVLGIPGDAVGNRE